MKKYLHNFLGKFYNVFTHINLPVNKYKGLGCSKLYLFKLRDEALVSDHGEKKIHLKLCKMQEKSRQNAINTLIKLDHTLDEMEGVLLNTGINGDSGTVVDIVKSRFPTLANSSSSPVSRIVEKILWFRY